jgi:hypothetical protein
MIRSLLVSLMLLAVAAGSSGCRALALLWLPEPTKTVHADFPYLADKSVAIAVRASAETAAIYPHVRWDVADHVRVALERHVPGIEVVDPREVRDFQRDNQDWEQMDPAVLGRQLGAQYLLEIELMEFTTREPESEYLFRGHITAAVRVYNTKYLKSQCVKSWQIHTVYPPDGPGGWAEGDRDRAIRAQTMEAFAEEVAGKFYDRKVKVE